MSFQEVRFQGFRRLADVTLGLHGLTVLIGANGIGKTSILDGLQLLARSASGNLASTLSELGGASVVVTADHPPVLRLGISVTSNPKPLVYDLELSAEPAGYSITSECLSKQQNPHAPSPFKYIDSHAGWIKYFDQGNLQQPTWQHNPLETSLAQVPKLYKEPEDFRRQLASAVYYHALDVSPRAPVRLPQPMRPATLPGRNGEDLVSYLYWLREMDSNRFEAIEDTLKTAFPGFERLGFPPVAAGTLALTWKDKNFSGPLFTNQFSEGMLRFLWLASLLLSGPSLSSLTLLDEPEVSLHPELLNLLADLLRGAAQHSQIVVATHADRLIRALQPSEVAVMDLNDDGTASVKRADQLDLEKWMQDFTLDELWSMGEIGAKA